MGFNAVQAITLGAILSGASTAVVLAVLKSNNVLDQAKMDILVLVMVIEDISQVIMISILTPMMKGGTMSTDSLIVLIIYIVLFMVLCFTLGLKIVPRIIDWFYERSNNELIALLCVGLLFVLALLANFAGLSVAIGAFLCGVMVGMSKPKEVVEHFIDPLKVLFMAMFFISVGMEVSVDSLVSNIPMIAVIYLIFIGCMFIAVNIGYWVANGDSRSGWISAFAMCTMGEFAFIISALALKNGVFDESFYSSVIGAAILSMVMLPLLVRSSDKSYAVANKYCPKFLKRIFAVLTKDRDLLYHGLTVVSYRSKERFNKGLTNSAFLIVLIVVIEITFYLIYTPFSVWLSDNIGLSEYDWRLIILFVNIVVLLDPCRRLAKFLRLVVYITERGKNHINEITRRSKDTPKIYEYLSTLHIGAAITVVIVILVPNGIEDYLHVVILLLVLMAAVTIQIYKLKKGVKGEKTEEPKKDEPSESAGETVTEEPGEENGSSE
jgi:CPA2 family monovalent cation:H+ antiporter-2